MAKTNFFKTTLFKCLVSLLAIALVASGLLAVLNDLLYVDDATRTARAIKKIYGREVSAYSIVLPNESVTELNYANGTIDKVYVVDGETANKYDVLIHSTGMQGYKGGTITLWIKVAVTEDPTAVNPIISKKIDKVIVDGYTKQTLMSKIGDKFLSKFYVDITDNYNGIFSMEDASLKEPVTGATKSGNAVCNAVNCALEYMSTWGGKA